MPSGAMSLRHVCLLHLQDGDAACAVLPGQTALSGVCSVYSRKTGGLQVCFAFECGCVGKGEVVRVVKGSSLCKESIKPLGDETADLFGVLCLPLPKVSCFQVFSLRCQTNFHNAIGC